MARPSRLLDVCESDKQALNQLLSSGVQQVRVVLRALVLRQLGEGRTASEVAEMVGLTGKAVRALVRRYRGGGLEGALYEKARPGKKRLLDASTEQRIVAMVCGAPPAVWCLPQIDTTYLACMEDVLELYERPHNPQEPVVCLDEKPVSLHGEVRAPEAARPGVAAKRDSEYKRKGTANVFCAVEPRAGRHFTFPTPRRSGVEFAKVIARIGSAYNCGIASRFITRPSMAVGSTRPNSKSDSLPANV